MRPPVLADTGFWIALPDRRDQNHLRAKQIGERLVRDHHILLSDFILFETLTYLNCSVRRHDLALRFLNKTVAGGLDLLEVDGGVKDRAVALFRQYADKDFSITDCTSFVLMREQGIRHFAGFDGHFLQMGFVSLIDGV